MWFWLYHKRQLTLGKNRKFCGGVGLDFNSLSVCLSVCSSVLSRNLSLTLSLSLSLSLFAHLVGIAHVTASLNYLPISAQMAKAQGFTVVYWRNKSH